MGTVAFYSTADQKYLGIDLPVRATAIKDSSYIRVYFLAGNTVLQRYISDSRHQCKKKRRVDRVENGLVIRINGSRAGKTLSYIAKAYSSGFVLEKEMASRRVSSFRSRFLGPEGSEDCIVPLSALLANTTS